MEAEPAHQADLTANVTPGSDSNPAPNPGVGEAPTAGRSTTPVNRAEITHQPRILSLDGGGVRGISALVILEEIMKEVRRRENLKDVPLPCDYFDLIGGTSTGGLIAIMLGRLRMSVEECIKQYEKLSEEVFNRDHVIFGVLPTGENGFRFDSSILKSVVKDLVNKKLKDPDAVMAETNAENYQPCPTFVVSTSGADGTGPVVLFRSYDSTKEDADHCTIWEAARATSAAPSFFDPIVIRIPPPGGSYVDGGVRYNNPSRVALDEARQIWPRVKRFSLISIGTGRQRNVEFVNIKDVQPQQKTSKNLFSTILKKVPGSGLAAGVKELKNVGIACVKLSTSSEPIHQELARLAISEDLHLRFPYCRFNVERGMDSIGMEEWKATLRIGELTRQYMREVTAQEDKIACAKRLIEPPPIELLQLEFSEPWPHYYLVPQVYQPNPHFVGRDDLIEELRQKLYSSQPETYNHRVALHGMGGVGKTQLAVQYLFKHKSEYESVFWISAATRADFQSRFQQIAEKIKSVNNAGNDADAVAQAVLAWLKTRNSYLLIIDNLDDISIVHGYLSEICGDNCHVLITTRNRDPTGIPAQGLEVPVFEASEAVNLLLLRVTGAKQAEPELRSQAIKIVEELGYLALAIEHAAAHIRQSSSFSKFLDMYSKSRKSFLEDLPEQNSGYPRAVATTFLMSFNEVKKVNPDAAELVTLFAFLNPDGILVDFLRDGQMGLGEPLQSLLEDEFKFGKALGKLGQFSLIRLSNDRQTISIHRLVQAVIQDHLGPDRKILFAEATLKLFLYVFPNDFQEERRQTWQRYQSQIDGPLQRLSEVGNEGVGLMSLRLGRFLIEDGKFSAARQFDQTAAEIYTKIFGLDDHRTLTSMNNLAVVYGELGQFEKSVEMNEKLLSTRQRILGRDHPDTLISMNNLAEAYMRLGRLKEAKELNEAALEGFQTTFGKEHPNTLRSMSNLAHKYRGDGQVEKAAELHEKVLGARERTLGLEHPDTLVTMNNLAGTYADCGQVTEAAELHKKVLGAQERTLGLEHPDTLVTMNNLAVMYLNSGQVTEAAELNKQVLEVRQRMLGMEHPATLGSMNNLAVMYGRLGHTKDSVELHKRVLDARQRMFGMEHPNTMISSSNLLLEYVNCGQLNEAAALHKKLLKTIQTSMGMERRGTWNNMIEVARGYRERGLLDQAAELYEKLLEGTWKEIFTLISTEELATLYWDLSRHEDSITLQQSVPDLCRRVYGEKSEATMMNCIKRSCVILLYMYRKVDRLEEATQLEAELGSSDILKLWSELESAI